MTTKCRRTKVEPSHASFRTNRRAWTSAFRRVKPKVELQTEAGSFLEFETNWFRKWSDLKAQIKEAVDIVGEINAKMLTFSEEKALKRKGLLQSGEQLEVKINNSSFKADIQSTEGIALSQYGSLLKEHERAPYVSPVMTSAQKVLNDAKQANRKIKPTAVGQSARLSPSNHQLHQARADRTLGYYESGRC